jgi:glycosyltransferase involved in cell wall biosynthesis
MTLKILKILLHGLNFAPEEIGIGKYSGEMVYDLLRRGCDVTVVTTPPYYPQWKIRNDFRKWGWWRDPAETKLKATEDDLRDHGERRKVRGRLTVIRCPLWVPGKVNGLKRIVHLASFGLSSVPAVVWSALRMQPDVIMTVEPAAFCMPTTWLAARLCGAKAWLHVQDFEVDAAFELGILKQPLLKKAVLAVEAFLMRRFDRVSTISTSMIDRLATKGVDTDRTYLFANWVDCDAMRPLENPQAFRKQFNLPADKCIALYAGNIGAKQGLELIVEAARMTAGNYASGNSDLHFVICGHGAAFPAIEAAVYGTNPEPMALATGDAGTKLLSDRQSTPEASAYGAGVTCTSPAQAESCEPMALATGDAGTKLLSDRQSTPEASAYGSGVTCTSPAQAESCEPMALATGDAGTKLLSDRQSTPEASAYGSGGRRVGPLSNLTLLPVQPYEVFNELMNCADIHLLPQKGDAADLVMPSKLTGMLATGRPVVACASPGTQIAQVVAGSGAIVPPGDVIAFTDAVVKLADDPDERARLGKVARAYAIEHLSKKSILDRFYAELQSLTRPS